MYATYTKSHLLYEIGYNKDMQLKNKIAVVTGGTDGLGLSIVKKFLDEGCIVHAISKSGNSNEVINNDKFFVHKGNVTSYIEIKAIAKKIGDFDILINNAGIWLYGSVEENSDISISELIDTNIKGVIYSTKAFLPNMRGANPGYIINISSMAGLRGKANHSVYVASKFAVTGFTESLSEDLKNSNIKVSGIYPGGMNTRMFEKAGIPRDTHDWLDTEKVSEIIVFMLKVEDSVALDHIEISKKQITK